MTVEIEEVGVLNTMVAIPAEHAYYVAFVQMSGGKDWYPKGLERDYWIVWQAAWNAATQNAVSVCGRQ